jgi:hypothetical protein
MLHASGTGNDAIIVDGSGKEVILKGLAPGELYNMENYMIGVSGPDIGGMGETKFRNAVGMALGPAADMFFTTWEANLVAPSDVADWGKWGINSIRLPMNHHMLSLAAGMYIDAGFQKIDNFIAMCKSNNIYVILDLHAAPGAQNPELMGDSPDGIAHLWVEPAKYRQWTIDLWQTIAKRYASEPAVGGYDIFDEPYDGSNGSFTDPGGVLRPFYVDVTAAIRAVDPNHLIFFEGGDNWASGFTGLEPAWDPNMAWDYHEYGAGPGGSDTPLTMSDIKDKIDLRTRTSRPIWNGETGEHSAAWGTAMAMLHEANHIGWNWWTFKKSSGQNSQPYTIADPPDWSAMATYLANGGAPPSDATSTMMALANGAATSTSTRNDDIVAIFQH